MLKFIAATFVCCLLLVKVQAQIVSNINFDDIKRDISQPGPNNYQALIKRVSVADSSLTADDYKRLYFGQVFQANYSPYGESIKLNLAQNLIASNDLQGGLDLVEKYLLEHPVSLGGIYDKMVILSRQKNTTEMKRWVMIYKGLIAAITTSGDGKTDKTAMVVANVSDEYKIMPAFGVKSTSQTLTNTQCDEQTLQQPNNAGLTELYFNVSKALAKGFN